MVAAAMASKLQLLLSLSRRGVSRLLLASYVHSPSKWAPCQVELQLSRFSTDALQRFGFSSSASPEPVEEADASTNADQCETKDASTSVKRERKKCKRTTFSDSDGESDLSMEDLVKLVAKKEELLTLKDKEIEKMQDKVLRSYAEMENIKDRAKREAENSKKFAIQNFAKSLLDVADNLSRASSVVKKSFMDIDLSKDSSGAATFLKTLLEGVEMTEKQLAEVFREYGVEKFDPSNEQFDPNQHLAVFQIPDSSKEPGIVAAVLKPGYTLHKRVIRPAEVGVTAPPNDPPRD